MRAIQTLLCLLVFTGAASAEFAFPVNCAHQSLQSAINFAFPGTTLALKGSCAGPISIKTDGLTLNGAGTASITGGGKDAVTINGAQRVTLTGLTVTGGNNGVVAENNASVTLTNVTITANALTGLLVEANSSAAVNGGGSSGNGLDGVDLETLSSLTVSGAYSTSSNGVFGLFINNGSSLSLTAATLTAGNNVVGAQVGTNAAAFEDGASTFNASNNFAIGLTMVSGAHMADFGGVLNVNSNGLQGIAIDARAGLDLDAGALVQANGNAGDGVHLEQFSQMTIFNTPAFSGVSATTTLTVNGNSAYGIDLLTNSAILVDNVAEILVSANAAGGVALDDGSSLSFGQNMPVPGTVHSTVVGNHPDIALTFASRLTTLGSNILGTITCDATSLTRGPLAVACPH
ncbi:MAG TPA: hypothetical protein VKB38_11785 [Terracidiphilus sp.]|nr:hypothetical protein [Terracidiphilus sp.]